MAMAMTSNEECLNLDLDLPNRREYTTEENAELDEALVQAIVKAEEANNEFLAQLLRSELQSHYYGSQVGI